MNSSESELRVSSGLLLCRDLIFISKITGTAKELGCRMVVAGDPASALRAIDSGRPQAVFVDLSAGDLLVGVLALETYQKAALPGTTFLAFGSHVDAQALAAARSAGCDPVMPRSKFSAELPALIKRYLGAEATPPLG